jgi:hypothetical protein
MDDLENIPESLICSIEQVGGKALVENMDLLYHNRDRVREAMKQPKGNKKSFRKLVVIPDKEYKSRPVAIGDYWSQTSLKPLHDWIFSILKAIPQDSTFQQDRGLRNMPLGGSYTFYSFDLSSATDRFPI